MPTRWSSRRSERSRRPGSALGLAWAALLFSIVVGGALGCGGADVVSTARSQWKHRASPHRPQSSVDGKWSSTMSGHGAHWLVTVKEVDGSSPTSSTTLPNLSRFMTYQAWGTDGALYFYDSDTGIVCALKHQDGNWELDVVPASALRSARDVFCGRPTAVASDEFRIPPALLGVAGVSCGARPAATQVDNPGNEGVD